MHQKIVDEINRLKKEKNAVIFAHYYEIPEIQEIADYVGDSYYLSKIARKCTEEVIVFCGVKFMGESAKILSPEKKVLLPVMDAGCPMADMATAKEVLKFREKYPDAKAVCYINSSAEVKAVCDVCCTSSNAVKIVKNIDSKRVIFLPDKNLGEYVQKQVPEKEIILWKGFCPVHNEITVSKIIESKKKYPGVKVLAHPECSKEIRNLSDFLGSTGQIIDFATKSFRNKFLILTEEGVLHKLQKSNLNKKFFVPEGGIICKNMKKTKLEDVYNTLLKMENEVHVEEDVRNKAYNALNNMHVLAE